MESRRALTLIESLGLIPHPEGGYYREIIRTPSLTSIYFLLVAPDESRWHRIVSDEVWHFYEGDPLELRIADPATRAVQRVVLDREHRSHVVPGGQWQSARSTGEHTLVGCTVAPPFEFKDFELLPETDHF